MVLAAFRLAFLCLTSSPTLCGYRAAPLTTTLAYASRSVERSHSQPHKIQTRRTMTTEDNANADAVGLADIGAATARNGDETEAVNATNIKSWRAMLEASSAKSRKVRGGNYVQIATVDPVTNQPRCRTVVFRGFVKLPEGHSCYSSCDNFSCIMKMITDSRSQKVVEVMGHPNRAAELVWWFGKSSEQYRVTGELLFVGSGQFPLDQDRDLLIARKEQWGNLSDSARDGFLVEPTPGASYSGEAKGPAGGRDEEGHVMPPPDNFLLMLLIPKSVDYLLLTNNYRQLDEKSATGDWSSLRINP
jgi:pyridoxamine 5'-phosphate oxidase